MPHIPAALRAIIASELVPPYASVQPAPEATEHQQQQKQNGGDDVNDASALLTERQHQAPAVPRSRYIQMPAQVRVDGGDVDAAPDDGAGAFTYNCTAGMIFRETTV